MKSHLKIESQSLPAITETIHLEKVSYLFGENGLTYISFKEGHSIDLLDSEKEYKMLMERKEKLPLKAVVFVEPFVTISKNSLRFWLTGKGKGLIEKEAILSNELAPRIMLIGVKKLIPKFDMQVKIFKSLKRAENWALGL